MFDGKLLEKDPLSIRICLSFELQTSRLAFAATTSSLVELTPNSAHGLPQNKLAPFLSCLSKMALPTISSA